MNLKNQQGMLTLVIILIIVLILVVGGTGFWIWKLKKDNQALKNSLEVSADIMPEKKAVPPAEDKNGPYYHAVYSAASTDGISWKKDEKMLYDHASVPGAVLKDGIIYLYFVDASEKQYQLSVAQSNDLGKTFNNKQIVKIKGQEQGSAADPHPELVNGRIRLYFLGDFSTLPNKESDNQSRIYSAESTDGINFFEPKLAYTGEKMNTDPDVFPTNQDWRMLISNGQNLILAISQDGGLSFTKQENFSWSKGGVSDTIKIGDNYNTYYCAAGIEYATEVDSEKLTAVSVVIPKDSSNQIVCDPSVIQLPDKNYLMFYKVQKNAQPENQPNQNSPN